MGIERVQQVESAGAGFMQAYAVGFLLGTFCCPESWVS